MDTKKYNKLDPFLHHISSQLKQTKDDRKMRNKQLKIVLEDHLLPVMKEQDEIFKKLFQKLKFCGSSFENLRIGDANEFDLNLELRSCSKKEKFLQVDSDGSVPGFVQVRHLSSNDIGKWVDDNEYVLVRKVYSWLQSVVDKALNSIRDAPWRKIYRKTSGPAVTLYVECSAGDEFSVDLVPVFVFDNNEWPEFPVRQPVITQKKFATEWSVVPKSPSVDVPNFETFWRMSFYNQEKQIINDKNHLKNIVKLLKKLRDAENWKWLSSYYIKSLVLWVDLENNVHFWNTGIGVLFMQMLGTLKDYLKITKAIPFFWDERHNLLSSVKPVEIEKIGCRLVNILNHINRNIDGNPACILNLFGVSESSVRSSDDFALSPFRGSLPSQEDDEDELRDVSLLPQQQSSVGWDDFAIGVGALAIGGALLYKAFTRTRDD